MWHPDHNPNGSIPWAQSTQGQAVKATLGQRWLNSKKNNTWDESRKANKTPMTPPAGFTEPAKKSKRDGNGPDPSGDQRRKKRKGNHNLYYAMAGGYAEPRVDYVNTVSGFPDKEDDHPGYLMPIRIYANLSASRQYNAHNTNIPSLRVLCCPDSGTPQGDYVDRDTAAWLVTNGATTCPCDGTICSGVGDGQYCVPCEGKLSFVIG